MKNVKLLLIIELIFIAIYLIIGSFLLLGNPHVGLADNGDYNRITEMTKIQNDTNFTFTNSVRFFKYNSQYAGHSFEYISSQLIPVKISKLVSLWLGNPLYDIHLLGLIYLIISALGLFLLFDGIRRLFPKYLILTCIFTTFIFSDVGYLSYFNSFYGEAGIFSFLILFIGCTVYSISLKKMNLFHLIAIALCAILFIGAKQANAPSGFFISAFFLCLIFINKDKFKITATSILAITILSFSIYCYNSITPEIRNINQYHSVFLGVLKDSNTPEKDLEELGFDKKLSVLANTTFYDLDLPINQKSTELKNIFYDKFSYFDILKFYLLHPQRFYEKLDITAAHSNLIRPPYLGNHQFSEVGERLTFEKRFSAWSTIKKLYIPSNLLFILFYFLLFSVFLIYELKKSFNGSDKRYFLLACFLALNVINAAINFVIPILADGEGDIAKHLFYYTLSYDFMLITGFLYALHKAILIINYIFNSDIIKMPQHNKFIQATEIIICIIFILFISFKSYSISSISISPIKNGDFIQIGNYKEEPILWQVYYMDDKQINLISYRAIDKKSFSIPDEASSYSNRVLWGTNNWEASSIRIWLNSQEGFLSSFTNKEKIMLRKTRNKFLLSDADKNIAEGGTKSHYWSNPVKYLTQNYNVAYYKNIEDTVSLPDAIDIEENRKSNITIIKKDYNGKSIGYWLKMPYSKMSSMVRFIDTDGFVYHKDAYYDKLGIVPCISISKSIDIVSGTGSFKNPFKLK